jgi:N utilization substance protein A
MDLTAPPDDADGRVSALFAREVPEIASGVVTVRAVARVPGVRTKVAVESHDSAVDPVEACVGPEQRRIYRIVDALDGERVDVLPWSPSAERMIRNALAPMRLAAVALDPALGRAVATLGPDQYPFIVNYRAEHRDLASRLTGWDITIVDPPAA